MNQNYKCADFFPTWYKAVDPAPTNDLVKKRMNGINALIELDNINLWLDIVKIANGDKDYNAENVALLVKKFKDFDIAFPIISNENILKILSQISLCFLFESSNKCSHCVSMAVINSNFLEHNESSEIPYCKYAVQKNTLNYFSKKEDISEIEEKLLEKEIELQDSHEEEEEAEEEEEEEEKNSLSYQDSLNLIKMVNYLNKENKKIKEESNVLWWLFGEYSTINNSFFSDISVSKIVTIVAQELVDLTINTGYLSSARNILSKAIIIANKGKSKLKEISIAESILESSDETKNKLLSNGDLGLLTPLLFCVNLSKQSDQTEIWKSICNQKIGNGNLEKKYIPTEIAFQFYNEIVFLNLLTNLRNE